MSQHSRKLHVRGAREQLLKSLSLVGEGARRAGLSATRRDRLQGAVREACMAILEVGEGGSRADTVEIEVDWDESAVTVSLLHAGPGLNALFDRVPPDPRVESMRQAVDELSYVAQAQRGHQLSLRTHLTAPKLRIARPGRGRAHSASHPATANRTAPAPRARARAHSPAEPEFLGAPLHLLCHDIRIPLTSIAAYAELLGGVGLPEEQRAEFLAAVQSQARRLARMVDDLESLAPHEPASPGVPRRTMDVCRSIRETLAEVQAGAPGRNPPIASRGTAKPLHAPADGGCFERALAWVLEAGLRHGTPGRPIRVRAGQGAGRVRVSVKLQLAKVTDFDLAALRSPGRSAAPPDLVRGIAGPMALALQSLARTGARIEVARSRGGLEWTFLLPAAGPKPA